MIDSIRDLVPEKPALPEANGSPQLHTSPDFPFKGWQPPQPDHAEGALVIDNGRRFQHAT